MAIVKMKKLHVIAMADRREELLKGLLHLGCVEISEPKEVLSDPQWASLFRRGASSLAQRKGQLTDVNTALDAIRQYAGLKDGMFIKRHPITEAEFLDTGAAEKAQAACDAVRTQLGILTQAQSEAGRLESRIAALTPCKGQPRKHFDEAALDELAASIRSQGVIQPLLVRPRRTETATIYEIVAGERRWRAAQRAGLTEVPVYLRELSDEDALTAALIENLQREDLNPLEEAQAIQSLRERLPYSQEELAQRLGKSRSAVANSLRLLQLPRPMQDALKDGVFTPGHARAVLALPERALQDILFNAVMTRRLSVRDAEEAVIHWKRHGLLPSSLMGASAPVVRSARAPKPACIKLAIRQLRENVAPKASISGTDRAGRITLPYESEEQLAELLSRLGLSVELSEAKPE